MKAAIFAFLFGLFYALLVFGGDYLEKNHQCQKAETRGAEVVWIQHKLFSQACYVNVTIDKAPVHMDAEDWLQYFVLEKEKDGHN